MRNIKEYDRYLDLHKTLDGTIKVKRQSPFAKERSFDILTIRNQIIGSGMWLLKKLQQMDNQKVDIVSRVSNNNKAIQRKNIKKDVNNKRTHHEVADFLTRSIH